MSAELYPAIDLLGGKCVRLRYGDYAEVTDYDQDPVDTALGFERAGAKWIHVVDLDAARSGVATNRPVIEAIADSVAVPVQTGGGVRTVETARALFDHGVKRVVMGTAAVGDPALVDRVAAHGEVAVGLDVKGRDVAVHGWTESSGRSLGSMLSELDGRGAAAVIVTQIERDGTLEGPDLTLLSEALDLTDMTVIASGGVGSIEDLLAIAELACRDPQLGGVIIGKALYEGVISIEDALAAMRPPEEV
ncbi:MAG: 1-(5-phosphoribosyl)-5-[(5-phosphoribosylamino)methylideneamino]imidazole-4-carboxamide isomerase [Acidobacteria bacterium]|nr:1-(5-phosphoribosyl)-5-[(5-phosphoribosylamino)methylideneamino]imidazole-4-carboxamide isomerase [Acidobacteriota bacterium]